MSTLPRLPLLALLAVGFTACGPGLEITSPSQDQLVLPDAENQVTLDVASYGWEIAEPGACGDREACGHLVARLTADERTGEDSFSGVVCGDDVVESSTTRFTVDLDACPRQVGLFSVLVHLHTDDHVSREGSGVAAVRRFIAQTRE